VRGTVVTWLPTKGFGFVKPDLARQDVILHASDVVAGPIFEGARVEFTTKPNTTPRGLPKAIDVKVMASHGG
jgi:cold shock CspA family protein